MADIQRLAAGRCEKPHGVDCLSAPQRHVAVLVAQGHTNREVAKGLNVSIKTVEYHLSSIYVQLGLRNRTELAMMIVSQVSRLPDALRDSLTDVNGEGGL